MIHRLAIICLAALTGLGFSGNSKYGYPQNDFISPIPEGLPIILAGTFAELRSNHFHGGLDIKTKGQTGMPLHAIADGYVSRINVSSYGYGNALYIAHPNGYTSVYAHLESYGKEIDEFIKTIQTEKESWELEVYPGKSELKVKQGEVVAISGNTGASRAPHLHFEIRDTRTQIPIDPLLFGYEILDDINPRIYRFQIHPVGDRSMARVVYTNGKSSTSTRRSITTRVRGSGGKYRLYPIKEVQCHGKIGFSISAKDFHTGSFNSLGVPIIEMKVNGKIYFSHDTEKIPFSKTRYLNAFIDYEAKKRHGRYYYRNHILPGNKLSIYPNKVNDGYIELTADTTYYIEFRLADRNGNESTLSFTLKGLESYNFPSSTIGPATVQLVPHDKNSMVKKENIVLEFPNNGFYEDFELQYNEGKVSSKGFSHIHEVHNGYTPIHKFFTIKIKPLHLPEKLRDKALISRYGRSIGGYFEDGYVVSRSKYFGKFHIDVDTIKPSISLYNIYEGKNMYRNSAILVRIGDNMSGVASYKAFIDNEFAIMSYNYKSGFIKYPFEKNFPPGEHELVISVLDRVGNSSTKKVKFKR